MPKNHLKVLVVVASYKPAFVYGGPVYSIGSLCEVLRKNNIDVTVLTTNANGRDDFPFKNHTVKWIDGVKVIYYRRNTGDPTSVSFAHTWALMKCIREFDVIHIQGWWNWVAIMSLMVSKIFNVPHILSTRGALSEYTFRTKRTRHIKKWMHYLFFKRMLSQTLLHVTSKEEANKFKGVLPVSRVVNIPNIVQYPEARHLQPQENSQLQLIFLGRIDPVKNLELLIRSLQEVPFAYHLTIVGDGEKEYLGHLNSLINNCKHISFSGAVYGEEKFSMLANADLLVLLSHTENFGNVILEGLSQGTAVLVSKNVGAADIVSAFDLGWVIAPEKSICVDALIDINRNRQRLKEIRRSAPAIIHAEFSPPALAARYIQEGYGAVNSHFKQHNNMQRIV